jgi:hypothetical protein
VNSIMLNEQTTAKALMLYDIMNRVNPSIESLTIAGKVALFPKDIAVRSAKNLHTLAFYRQGTEQLRKLMISVREWGSMGGSLHKLTLKRCAFGDEAVDFGSSCDALTELSIYECSSALSTTPVDSGLLALAVGHPAQVS